MQMKIINCTPHPINIVNPETKEILITFPKGKIVPRLKTGIENLGIIDYGAIGIAVTRTTFGDVENLPEKKEGVILIVSRLVKQVCTEREDLLVPGSLVRDEEGNVIGCEGLSE